MCSSINLLLTLIFCSNCLNNPFAAPSTAMVVIRRAISSHFPIAGESPRERAEDCCSNSCVANYRYIGPLRRRRYNESWRHSPQSPRRYNKITARRPPPLRLNYEARRQEAAPVGERVRENSKVYTDKQSITLWWVNLDPFYFY